MVYESYLQPLPAFRTGGRRVQEPPYGSQVSGGGVEVVYVSASAVSSPTRAREEQGGFISTDTEGVYSPLTLFPCKQSLVEYQESKRPGKLDSSLLVQGKEFLAEPQHTGLTACNTFLLLYKASRDE
ncbi:hypothetical protein E2C01_023152 [Portunus trituberculatus]|uniref:Uncharacterized protein n=1 Tax=Portunus trituberculatus TaxID=210409 RepID=A0A5B7E786_PORTR|nr:hypothetical protein [Portunus trituberculatus]